MDAWGNHKVLDDAGTENTSDDFIGNINPIRYRGYYYDRETNLYYLINKPVLRSGNRTFY